MHVLILIQYYGLLSLIRILIEDAPHELLQSLAEIIVVVAGVLDVLQSTIYLLYVVLLITSIWIDQIHHVIAE